VDDKKLDGANKIRYNIENIDIIYGNQLTAEDTGSLMLYQGKMRGI
jgi:hypothetical protein